GTRQVRVGANGTVNLASITFLASKAHAGSQAIIDWNPDTIIITTTDGEVLAQYPWPAPGTRYVSTHTHPTPPTSTNHHHTPQDPELSPMS
ncbi:hypothetical protein SAMN05216355_11092, partial [Actinomyces ruminicola]